MIENSLIFIIKIIIVVIRMLLSYKFCINITFGMNDTRLPQVNSTTSTKKITSRVDLVGKSNHRLSQTGKAILSKDILEKDN